MWHILKHYTPLKIPVSKWNEERQISTRKNGTLHTEKQSGEPSRELSQPTHRSCIFFSSSQLVNAVRLLIHAGLQVLTIRQEWVKYNFSFRATESNEFVSAVRSSWWCLKPLDCLSADDQIVLTARFCQSCTLYRLWTDYLSRYLARWTLVSWEWPDSLDFRCNITSWNIKTDK